MSKFTIKTEQQRLKDIERQIRSCLEYAGYGTDLWCIGHVSGLNRALDFVTHARIEQERQSKLFSED